MTAAQQKNTAYGIILAIAAVLIWSVNFVIARDVYKQIPSISLSFYRWSTASVIILPIAFKNLKKDRQLIVQSWKLIVLASICGVSLFNTLIYIGAHYTSAINLALIGNTVSPITSVILAAIFLNEKITRLKTAGIALCICGIIFLLSKGSLNNLLNLHFSAGDGWVALAALSFSCYTTLVRKKPVELSPLSFLAATFITGTLILLPFFLWESSSQPIAWNNNLYLIVLYLGLCTSVISFFCWNYAIKQIGAGRTALFGNLIPIFSSIEAVLFLQEPFTFIHLVSMIFVFAGLVLANISTNKNAPAKQGH